jgi:hypothetical protein
VFEIGIFLHYQTIKKTIEIQEVSEELFEKNIHNLPVFMMKELIV